MPLTPGTRLGPYEILSAIGAGGMGEVYRATDTTLKRGVAIKVLPIEFAADADRLLRFRREAEVLAALNHPHIAAIYGLESIGGTSALIMELVEGEDLAQRLARGAIPLDEGLPLAIQIAEALEAAHEQGIVHRDLKPANIRVRADGTVKVVDFGLAKAIEPVAASAGLLTSPTMTSPAMTRAGVILGTATYMAPEQAKGRSVDRRADIWGFGAVLFEMLTGTRAFVAGDVHDTIVAILRDEPDWTRLPAGLPPTVATYLKRCLHKDPMQRVQAMGDVLLALQGAFDGFAASPVPTASGALRSSAARLWPLLIAATLIAAGLLATSWRRQPVTIDLSAYRYRAFAFTPAQETNGVWSPDGKSVAFLQGNALAVQSLDATAATLLADHALGPLAWSPDGTRILFQTTAGIEWVSAAGGKPERVLNAQGVHQIGNETRGIAFDFSPDGKTLAVWRYMRSPDGRARSSVWFSPSIGAPLRPYEPAPFGVQGSATPVYLRFSRDGRQLYVSMFSGGGSGPSIWILPFPPGTGAPRQLFRNVTWAAPVQASWMPDDRTLVLSGSTRPGERRALWLADSATESLVKLSDRPDDQVSPSVSPDGMKILFTNAHRDADVTELPLDGSAPRKLLATSLDEYDPGWSPRGGQFAYVTERNGSPELWLRSVSGEWDRPVVTPREVPDLRGITDPAFAPDGTHIAYTVFGGGERDPHLYVSAAAGGTPTKIGPGTAPSWSPDGAAIAYVRWADSAGFPLASVRLGSAESAADLYAERCESVQWSPSGDWIACGTASGQPVLVSPDGKIHRTLAPMDTGIVTWSQDGRILYGILRPGSLPTVTGDQRALVALDIRTNTARKIAVYGPDVPAFFSPWAFGVQLSRSPDGRSVAVGTATSQADLWILEGFPRR